MAFLDAFKKEKKPNSPTKAGEQAEGSISADIIPFLNIIAKNSLALPGMARDMNVLRQNIVKLVKLKNAEAATKADKFFKTEDQREAELEAARKKETAPIQEREGKVKKEKMEKGGEEEGFLDVLWDLLKGVLGGLFLGLGMAFAKVFDLGKIVSDIADKLNPMPLIEGLFKTLKEGWQKITETDIVKETLIKGFGKFLDFITAGLFGEKELRKSLDDLTVYLTPMIDVLGETFDKVVAWLRDNVGWDSFTIPLSKATDFLPDWAKSKFTLPDITIPGFRPFKKAAEKSGGAGKGAGGGKAAEPAAPTTTQTTPTETPKTAPNAILSSPGGMDLSVLSGGDKEKEGMLSGFFSQGAAAGSAGDASAMFGAMTEFGKKYKEKYPEEVKRAEEKKAEEAKKASQVTEKKAEETKVTPASAAPAEAAKPYKMPEANRKEYVANAEKDYNGAISFMKRVLRILPRGNSYEDLDTNQKYSESEVKKKIKEAGANPDKVLSLINPKSDGTKLDVSSGNLNTITGGAIGGGAGTSPMPTSGGGGGGSPSPATSSPSSSGAALSSASSEVAEGQRKDSAADAGVFIDSGTVTSGSTSTGKQPKQTASAYNVDFNKAYA